MATTYQSFLTYPLEITGITSEHNPRIAAIEEFILSDMEYSGEDSELTAILPYFIFWFFLQDKVTDATTQGGENLPILKDSQPDVLKQIANWNTGVKKLRDHLGITQAAIDVLRRSRLFRMTESEYVKTLASNLNISINENYLSKRSIL